MLALLGAGLLPAQTVTGTLEGRVMDSSGGVIPGAQITAKNSETGLVRTTETNQDGFYQLTFLPVGSYTVKAEAAGFAAKERAALVELNATRTISFEMKPAAVATAVQVTAEVPLIDITRGDVKGTIDEKTIEDRALSSRNILALVEMLPGFQTSGGYSGVNNPTQSSGGYVSFNGTGTRSAAFQIDGVGNDDSSEGTNRQNVNISSIKELQVLTNAYTAEFGRAGGAVVLVQTKSGTNRFHGDLYEYLQNDKLNANTFFNNSYGLQPDGRPVAPRSLLRRNQFGYTAGGPIIKNKLFFFHSFEQTRNRQYGTSTKWIFLANEKLQVGDCKLCLNPAQHPNLQRDTAFLQGIMDRYPKVAPNNLVACDHCFTQMLRHSYPDQDYSGRLDYNATKRDTFALRYQYSRQKRMPGQAIGGEATRQNNKQQNVGLTATHMFNAMTWGEFRFGVGLRTTMVDIADGNNTPILRISTPAGYTTTMGSSGAYPIHRYQTDYQWVYNLSHVRGKHVLRAGIDFRRQHLDDLADNYSRGWYTFGATGTVGTASRYEGWENFMRGYTTDFQIGYGNFTTFNRLGEFNQYVMDDIRVKPNVTLNLGFRYEVVLTPSEVNGKIKYNFADFTRGYEPRFGLAWSPRFESALLRKLTGGPGRSSIRAGFGLFHNRIFQSIFSQNNISLRSLPPYGAYRDYGASYNVADPSNGFVYTPGFTDPGRITMVKVDPNLGMPEIQQYHLTFERQLPGQISVSIGYTRTRGIGLLLNQITNRARFPFTDPATGILYDKIDPDLGNTNPAPGYISAAQPRTNQRRPDVRYTTVYTIMNQSWSYYNALRLEVKKRFSKGLLWQLNYAWGKTIDTGTEITAGNPISENGSALSNRALSDLDQRHRVNINASYTLPFFSKSKGFAKAALNGWTTTTNITFASGNPFTATAGVDLNADGVSNDRPLLLNQSLFGKSIDNGRTDSKTGVQYSVEAFPLAGFFPLPTTLAAQRPFNPGGTGQGSIGRNTFFGEGLKNFDLGIYKRFKIREGQQLMFRAEAYGAMNTPRFAFPAAATNAVSFGRITGTYNPFNFVGASRSDSANRQIQLALRYTF
jgi:hypothetical protein